MTWLLWTSGLTVRARGLRRGWTRTSTSTTTSRSARRSTRWGWRRGSGSSGSRSRRRGRHVPLGRRTGSVDVVMVKEQGRKLIAQNKKARHDYTIEDTYEAGLV